jgi:hypothetical protein
MINYQGELQAFSLSKSYENNIRQKCRDVTIILDYVIWYLHEEVAGKEMFRVKKKESAGL